MDIDQQGEIKVEARNAKRRNKEVKLKGKGLPGLQRGGRSVRRPVCYITIYKVPTGITDKKKKKLLGTGGGNNANVRM